MAAGVPFGWVAGDTVYGNDRRLRRWLEEQGIAHVLAVKSNESLWADTERGSAQVAARQVVSGDTGRGLATAERWGRDQRAASL